MIETWTRAADASQTRPEWKSGVVRSRTMGRLARRTSFSQRLALSRVGAAGIAIAGGGLRGIRRAIISTEPWCSCA